MLTTTASVGNWPKSSFPTAATPLCVTRDASAVRTPHRVTTQLGIIDVVARLLLSPFLAPLRVVASSRRRRYRCRDDRQRNSPRLSGDDAKGKGAGPEESRDEGHDFRRIHHEVRGIFSPYLLPDYSCAYHTHSDASGNYVG